MNDAADRMKAKLPKTRKGRVRTAIAVIVALGLVAVVMVVEPWSTTSYDIHDSGVWISRTAKGELGRVNGQAAELEVILSSKASILQDGDGVYQVEPGAGVTRFSSADPESSKTVALPGLETAAVGGGVLVGMTDDGSVSVLGQSGAVGNGSGKVPKVGKRGVVAVGRDGTIAAFDPDKGRLSVLAPGAAKAETSTGPSAGKVFTLTMVGSTPVVLDGDGGRLILANGETVALGSLDGGLAVQLPGPTASEVLVASDDGLSAVALSGGDLRTVSKAGTGSPIRPTVDDSCSYAAWKGRAEVRCEGAEPRQTKLENGRWAWRVGRGAVALNDVDGGTAYVVRDGSLVKVKPWPDDEDRDDPVDEPDRTPPNPEGKNKPTAVADTGDARLGARPGRLSYVDVLRNDLDKDRDSLFIHDIAEGAPKQVTVAAGGTALQVDLRTWKEGDAPLLTLKYRISDGDSSTDHLSEYAEVQIRVVTGKENREPRRDPRQELTAVVESGKSIDYEVLSAFWDPEGDPIYLESAADTDRAHLVTSDPSGWVHVTATQEGQANIEISVRDALYGGTTDAVSLTVKPAGEALDPVPRTDFEQIRTGKATLIEPLANDYDPNGEKLTLGKVTTRSGVPLDQVGEVKRVGDGFTFAPTKAGDNVLVYEAVGGGEAVRSAITISAYDADGNEPPIAMPDIVQVEVGKSAVVDLLANDVDPDGQVLSISDVTPPETKVAGTASKSGVKGGAQDDYRRFRVDASASAPVTSEDEPPVSYGYTVWDGDTDASATSVTVVVVPPAGNHAPQKVGQRPVVVRAGEAARIPVSAIATDPDGDPLTLEAVKPPVGAAASGGDSLRFYTDAKTPAGDVPVQVKVTEPRGNSITVDLTLRVVTGTKNDAPKAEDVEARVRAGRQVAIPVPLDDRDDNGDAVRIAGIEVGDSFHGIARVDEVNQTIVYEATEIEFDQQDQLSYQLVDAQGAVSAPATVRIGVLPVNLKSKKHAPVAMADRVQAGPDSSVWLQPVDNDTDLDGDRLALIDPKDLVKESDDGQEDYAPVGDCTVKPDAGGYSIATSKDGCTVQYAVGDLAGETVKDGLLTTPDIGTVEVEVVKGFEGLAPVVHDDQATAVPGKDTVAVDILANDSDPDTPAGDLKAKVRKGSKGQLDAKTGVLTATIGSAPQIVRYEVSDPQGHVSEGVVRIPGKGENHAPVAVKGPAIKVKAGDKVPVPLKQYIKDPDGNKVVYEPSSNRATVSLDGDTVVFETQGKEYSGPAVLNVRATDDGDPSLATNIAIPITITPAENIKPEWIEDPCSGKTAQQGWEPIAFNVRNASRDRDPQDNRTRTFRVVGSRKNGNVTIDLSSDGTLTAVAAAEAKVGSTAAFSIAVVDSRDGQATTDCLIQVTRYPGPALQIRNGEASAKQGESVPIDVKSLVSNGVGALKVDVGRPSTGTATASGSVINYRAPDKVALGSTANVPFTVTDKLSAGDETREVKGFVTVKLIGPPQAPSGVVATPDIDNGLIKISFTPGKNDGNPAQSFKLFWSGAGSGSKPCESGGCTVGEPPLKFGGNYVFWIEADNTIGDPVPSTNKSASVTLDRKTDAPVVSAGVPKGDGAHETTSTVSWSWKEPKSGTGIDHYEYEKNGDGAWTPVGNVTSIDIPGFANGSPGSLKVVAVSKSGQRSEAGAASTASNPYGAPILKVFDVAPDAAGNGNGTLTIDVDPNGADITNFIVSGCTPIDQASQPATVTGCSTGREKVTVSLRVVNKGGDDFAERSGLDFRQAPVVSGSPELEGGEGYVEVVGYPSSDTNNVTWKWRYDGDAGNDAGTDLPRDGRISAEAWTSVSIQLKACKRNDVCSDWSGSGSATPYGPADAAWISNVTASLTADNVLTVSFSFSPPSGASTSDFTFTALITGNDGSTSAPSVTPGSNTLSSPDPTGGQVVIEICGPGGDCDTSSPATTFSAPVPG